MEAPGVAVRDKDAVAEDVAQLVVENLSFDVVVKVG